MLMEALDICKTYAASSKPQPHPLMLARGTEDPDVFLLRSLALLRAPSHRLGGGGAGLEHSLGALTGDHARRLLPRLVDWLARGCELELVGRAIRYLTTLHFGLVTTCVELREALERSRDARGGQLARVKVSRTDYSVVPLCVCVC